jgi:hypothetical protein
MNHKRLPTEKNIEQLTTTNTKASMRRTNERKKE